MRKSGIVVAIAVLLAGGIGGALLFNLSGATEGARAEPQPVWNEGPWPFPMDQWGKGKAYTCKAADCGTDVTVYIRAKIGFCNCATGVADDEELDRISDFELFGNQLTAQAPGQPVTVAWMKGRSRPFAIGGRQRFGKSALSIGINDRCDAIVATAVSAQNQPAAIEATVLAFLNSSTVLRWAEVTLGL
jgi:hypothetical protein